MIHYLTHERWLDFNPAIKPSLNSGGGGMHQKTFRATQALSQKYITSPIVNTSDIKSQTVLVEPLRFHMKIKNGDAENNEQVIAGLKRHKDSGGKVILYCSEFTMLRISPGLRNQILDLCDAVTANCEFQARLFQNYLGIRVSGILCDPVPDIFQNAGNHAKRDNYAIAVGQVSYEKNAEDLIKVFGGLQKRGVKTCYVGSNKLWWTQTKIDRYEQDLMDRLSEVTDKLIPDANMLEVAMAYHNARAGVWVAWHDCFAQGLHELLTAGLPVVAAQHGLSHELPVIVGSTIGDIVKKTETEINRSPSTWNERSESRVEQLKARVSYDAFLNQFAEILMGIN